MFCADKTAAMQTLITAVAHEYPSPQAEFPHPLDLPHTSRLYKTLLYQLFKLTHKTNNLLYLLLVYKWSHATVLLSIHEHATNLASANLSEQPLPCAVRLVGNTGLHIPHSHTAEVPSDSFPSGISGTSCLPSELVGQQSSALPALRAARSRAGLLSADSLGTGLAGLRCCCSIRPWGWASCIPNTSQ